MSDKSQVLIKNPNSKKPPGKTLTSFENILTGSQTDQTFESEFKSAKRSGLMIAFIVFGVFGVWSLTMPIDGAAHAPGQVTVKSFKKPVQHLEGGIVKEVHVQDGDRVQTGQVLVVLDDTQARSQLAVLDNQLKLRLAQVARLTAERDNLPAVGYPAELRQEDPESMAAMASQNQIFKTRKTTLTAEVAVYQQRIEQLASRVTGLEGVRETKTSLAKSFKEEVGDYQSLLAEGFADKNRLRELERNYQATSGEAADLTTTIATTKMQIGEVKLEILQLQNKTQTEVAGQLSEAETQAKDLRDRITATADAVQRAQIKATDNGVINNLRVHTPGAVIPAGAILAEIVPQNEELVVDSKVSPMDIDRVLVGQDASLRLTAFNSRTVPVLEGKVISLSADSIPEANGASFYMARLELTPESMKALHGLPLIPGMPADVSIKTGSRTFFQYLMKPLTDSMAHSLRED